MVALRCARLDRRHVDAKLLAVTKFAKRYARNTTIENTFKAPGTRTEK